MLKSFIKTPLRGLLNKPVSVAPPNKLIDDKISTRMPQRIEQFANIPGMLPLERGTILYTLAYANTLQGDILEIGSWQGRSTCFLAQACRDSGNGIVRAVDHFKGNVGKEHFYKVGQDDLSDLESNFRNNIDGAGLSDHVKLYNMPAQQAATEHLADFANLRMLFIDGDHSYEGASHDIRLFAPLLQPGGIIVFDDYHSDCTGVQQAVAELIFSDPQYTAFTQFQGILIARKKPAL